MKKRVFTLIICVVVFTLQAQSNKKQLINTSYSALVDTICEETSIPDPCAGQEIYLTLAFKRKWVTITQESISSCGEIRLERQFKYKWHIESDNEVKIETKAEDIKYTSLEHLKLTLEDKTLYGFKMEDHRQKASYVFQTKK